MHAGDAMAVLHDAMSRWLKREMALSQRSFGKLAIAFRSSMRNDHVVSVEGLSREPTEAAEKGDQSRLFAIARQLASHAWTWPRRAFPKTMANRRILTLRLRKGG